MILWITGNSKAGKTTLARSIKTDDTIILDGDEMRDTISKSAGFSAEDRKEHNLRVARLAKLLGEQGFNVLVTLICPYESLREKVQAITGCKFLYLANSCYDSDPEYPYEYEEDKIYWKKADLKKKDN